MKILIFGKEGQIGWELKRSLSHFGVVRALDRREADLANPDRVRSAIREIEPGLIVNAAAYTAVDRAEDEPELAMAVNGVAPGVMAEEAKRLGAAIIHFSTDYVYRGESTRPYREADALAPRSVYGKTKLAGDRAIEATGVAHWIFRTCWVYGLRGRNFLLTIRRLASEGHELRVVNDQVGSPTWSRSIAQAAAGAIGRMQSSAHGLTERIGEYRGVYHLAAGGETSWHGFACAIIDALYDSDPNKPKIHAISSKDFAARAPRPAYSVLDSGKFSATFGLMLPDWRKQLKFCLAATAA